MSLVLVRNAGLSVAKVSLADGKVLNVQPKSDRTIDKGLLSEKQLSAIKSGALADCYVMMDGKTYEPKPKKVASATPKRKKKKSEQEPAPESEPKASEES